MCISWLENGEPYIANRRVGGEFYNQEHKFHRYVVIIHNFNPKPVRVVHTHATKVFINKLKKNPPCLTLHPKQNSLAPMHALNYLLVISNS